METWALFFFMDKIEMHKNLCEELNDIYAKKNHDYGDSFHETFLEEGMAMARIRLSDKLNRFKALTSNNSQQVQNESVRDTLMDLANYALMTVLEIEKEENSHLGIKKEFSTSKGYAVNLNATIQDLISKGYKIENINIPESDDKPIKIRAILEIFLAKY